MTGKNIFLSVWIAGALATGSLAGTSGAGEAIRQVILSAMRDELARNVESLRLANMAVPFFIHYTVRDISTLEIRATLGALTLSEVRHARNYDVRLMVGGYQCNDENYRDVSGRGGRNTLLQSADRLPLENNYDGIRRTLWLATDNRFKVAAEQYERKQAALQQQTLPPEIAALPDYTPAVAITLQEPVREIKIDPSPWERMVRDLSGVFRSCPDIQASAVVLYVMTGDEYLVNSEGTVVVRPVSLATLQIMGQAQADDGEELTDRAVYCAATPEALPSADSLARATVGFAAQLNLLRTAPIFAESYAGPVLFEGQAAAELFAQRLFLSRNGLLATRKPITNNPQAMGVFEESLEDRIGRRIAAREISIRARPQLTEYAGVPLVGCGRIDAEGIPMPPEISLVEKGILKTLLGCRIPTVRLPNSNGHLRPVLGKSWVGFARLGPSVIEVKSSKGFTERALRKRLLNAAKDEGWPYALVVKKLHIPGAPGAPQAGTSGGFAVEPALVYRVSVKDGTEELVRSVDLGDISLSALRHISGASKQQYVYNSLQPVMLDNLVAFAALGGIPASFITPQAVMLEELDARQLKRNYTPKLPLVANPLRK
jgi:hypothetical protein